ncbi:osmoprotectant ABC transporter substrate-binding protein [Bacillus testis]|uniref:osmoprotectant ABC transporter substrate-binding protein n=1 Tax=Bacillus testis TaxID=1622072 RepID=UPI00067F656C|nr:osmoprotectant ABC transporter substrate-binding protein [Bacillus testis]
MWKKGRMAVLSIVAAFTLSACSLPGLGSNSDESVRIATLNTSESQIVGQIIKKMIEHDTDLKAEMIQNLGSSIVQHQALTEGQVDITATRYTGTDLSGALGLDPVKDPKKATQIVQKEFKDRFDQTWYDSYGFANTYALTVTQQLAEKYHLQNVSDLESIAGNLKLGVDNAWLNRKGDGYDGFTEAYDFRFEKAFPMQLGLVYQAVKSGKMDVVLAYSTDGRLKAFNLKTLEDDKQFFPPYNCSPVINNDVLKEHPELDKVLRKLVGKIDNDTITELNYQSDVKKKEPATVAEDFLKKNNYFE